MKLFKEEKKQIKQLLKLNKYMSYPQAESIVLNRLNKQKRIDNYVKR